MAKSGISAKSSSTQLQGGEPEGHHEDPFAEWGPTQRAAVVWFFSLIVIGSGLTLGLSQIDRFLYQTKNRYLDYEAYTANRVAATTIGSEIVDPRSVGTLHDAYGSMLFLAENMKVDQPPLSEQPEAIPGMEEAVGSVNEGETVHE